jgi:hypothetical protein
VSNTSLVQEKEKSDSTASEIKRILKDLIFAAILAPLVVILTNALEDQHADNLITTIFSTDNLTLFFWNTNRAGNLIAILTWPFQNLEANLKAQVFIKTTGFLFVIIWIARRIAQIYGIPRVVSVIAAITVSAIFLRQFPESGDSVVYGGASQSIAVILIAIALSASGHGMDLEDSRSKAILREVLIGTLWILTGWLMILWLVRAPAFILIELAYRIKRKTISTVRQSVMFVGLQLLHICFAFCITAIMISQSGENTSLMLRGFRYYTTHTWYIWNFLLITLVLVILLLAWSRISLGALLAIAATWILFTTVATTALGHIRDNLLMPRYFAVGFFLAIVISCTALVAQIFQKIMRFIPKIDSRNDKRLSIAFLGIFLATFLVFASKPIGYGFNSRDTSGFNKIGKTLPIADYISLSRQANIEFVTGGFWDVWPTIYEWRKEGINILALVPPGQKQASFDKLLDGKSHLGICIRSTPENCKQTIQELTLPGYSVIVNLGGQRLSTTESNYPYYLVEIQVLPKQ